MRGRGDMDDLIVRLTKGQVDRLGDRLRKGDIGDDDLRLLDNYRRSFSEAYEIVVGQIRDQLGLEPTGRQEKTTPSIKAKLRRQSIRLSQMQDIAGCRIVVTDLLTQDEAVGRLNTSFDNVEIDDRREKPSHGYRAVHVIVEISGKLIEIQVRTALQHLWAEVSEKLADVDPSIKYGVGDRDMLIALNVMSKKIRDQELTEAAYFRIMDSDDEDEIIPEGPKLTEIMEGRLSIVRMLEVLGEVLPRMKGQNR